MSYPPFTVWPPVVAPVVPPDAAASEYFALNETWDSDSDEFITAALRSIWTLCATGSMATPIVPAAPIDPTADPVNQIWATPNAHGSWLALQVGSSIGDACLRRRIAVRPSLYQARWRFQIPTNYPGTLNGPTPSLGFYLARDNGAGLPDLSTATVCTVAWLTAYPASFTTYFGPADQGAGQPFIPGWYLRMQELNAGSGDGHTTDFPLCYQQGASFVPFALASMDFEIIYAMAGTVGWWYLRSAAGLQMMQGVHGGNPGNWVTQPISGQPFHVVTRFRNLSTSLQPSAAPVFNGDYVRTRSNYVVY